jgi:hypothetical protein
MQRGVKITRSDLANGVSFIADTHVRDVGYAVRLSEVYHFTQFVNRFFCSLRSILSGFAR